MDRDERDSLLRAANAAEGMSGTYVRIAMTYRKLASGVINDAEAKRALAQEFSKLVQQLEKVAGAYAGMQKQEQAA